MKIKWYGNDQDGFTVPDLLGTGLTFLLIVTGVGLGVRALLGLPIDDGALSFFETLIWPALVMLGGPAMNMAIAASAGRFRKGQTYPNSTGYGMGYGMGYGSPYGSFYGSSYGSEPYGSAPNGAPLNQTPGGGINGPI